ncbi:MAG: FHA domain-containing protein [Planctomycetes bacterium]|nr:FHA domain-containing protein [Planctomycetota bacterium]
MLKCPFCSFENEEGALFCEQCKSDLSGVDPVPMATPDPVPMAAVLEETVPMAQAVPAVAVEETPPMAEPVPAPVMAESATETPMAADMVQTPAEESPAPPAAPPAAPAADASPPAKLPDGAQPKLVVVRGQKIGVEFPIYPDLNFIGRADEKPVDIDLEDQEPPDRVWCSRQHALITFEEGTITIEDLNSANGTYVNRTRVYPGQKRPLNVGDTVQIGNVQMKLKV